MQLSHGKTRGRDGMTLIFHSEHCVTSYSSNFAHLTVRIEYDK